MKLVQVLSLAGTPIHLKVDLRTRNPDGSLRYDSQDKPIIGVLERVEIKKAGQCCAETRSPKSTWVDWLFWYYKPQETGLRFDCGYSGIRMDSNDAKAAHLEVLE